MRGSAREREGDCANEKECVQARRNMCKRGGGVSISVIERVRARGSESVKV